MCVNFTITVVYGGWRGGEGDYCPERCMHLSAATVRGNYPHRASKSG